MDLLAQIAADPAVRRLCAQLTLGRRIVARGAPGASTAVLAGAVARPHARPGLRVAAHHDEAAETRE
jgi:hypothetical protein